MRHIKTDVVVIGGGATGAGAVRDAAMRGYDAVLVDRADLGQGTSGRFHGLLHSGGRYVVSDPHSATECATENEIVSRIHADAVERCGGLFVATPGDPEDFPDRFLAGAQATGVPATEISIAEALRREPRLNPGIFRAFEVRDGSVDGWAMIWGAARSAIEHGATILTYHEVTQITTRDGHVEAVLCRDRKRGEDVLIECRFVLNCAGAWAGQIASMAGAHDVEVVPGRGIMIAMNHRLVNSVVNRCIYPADGDILVPVHTVSIIGTTDVKAPDPDRLSIPRDEVQQMLDAGEQLVPGFRQARALHVWAGARPLVKDTRVAAGDTRHMSRGMTIMDHAERDGIEGFLTISGGKLTTYRLMAERLVDDMCAQLGDARPCTTADETVPTAEGAKNYVVTHRLHERETTRAAHVESGNGVDANQSEADALVADQTLCECELLSRRDFETLLDEQPHATFDDLRRQLRLGMGPCQGGFCAMRATGVACSHGAVKAARANDLLALFLKNRWRGLWPILHGSQVRETALDNWIFQGFLDLDHLPPATEPVAEDVEEGLRHE